MKHLIFGVIFILFVSAVPLYSQTAEVLPYNTVMQAVVHNDIPSLAELVKNDAEIDEQNNSGTTPLIWAVRNGTIQMTDILVRLGANPTIKDDMGLSALDWAERGEKDIQTLDPSFKKAQILLSALKKPFVKRKYQRILFDTDTDALSVLNCDSLIETEETVFCQIKIGEKVNWEMYAPTGEYLGISQDIETVSHKGKEYFILKKWGEYSVVLPSGIPLKEHLKQVKYKIDKKKNALIFNAINVNGKKETFSPDINLKNLKK